MGLREQLCVGVAGRSRTGAVGVGVGVGSGIATLLLLVVLPSIGSSESSAATNGESAPDFEQVSMALRLSSLPWRAEAWPELTLQARQELQDAVEPEIYRQISESIAVEFDFGKLLSGITNAMMTPDRAGSVLAIREFYRGEPGAGLVADRARAAGLADFPVFVADHLFQPERLQARGAGQRRELLVRLSRSLGLADNVLMVAGAISRAFDAGSFLARRAPPPLGRSSDPRDSVEWARPFVEARTRLALDYAHRDRDLVELSRELRFADSREGKQAFAAASDALRVGLAQAANRVAIVSERAGRCDR